MLFFFLRTDNGKQVFVFFLKDFIYRSDRSQAGREAGSERGGSKLPAEQRARCRAQSQDPGIMTWAEGRGFNPLSHPGAPWFNNSIHDSLLIMISVLFILKILFIYLFIYFLRRFYLFIWQTEITSRQRGRQRERGKQAPRWAESPMWGSIPGLWDHDPSWRQRL